MGPPGIRRQRRRRGESSAATMSRSRLPEWRRTGPLVNNECSLKEPRGRICDAGSELAVLTLTMLYTRQSQFCAFWVNHQVRNKLWEVPPQYRVNHQVTLLTLLQISTKLPTYQANSARFVVPNQNWADLGIMN